jgi:adhesin transport system outer membrane protein
MRYKELVALANENQEFHDRIFKQIQSSTDAGALRRVDLDQAEGRLALAKNNLTTEISNLHDVSARYLRIVGNLPPENLQFFNLTNKATLPFNIESALTNAYVNNPAFHASLRNIDASYSEEKRQRSEQMPQLNLTGRYGLRNNDLQGNRTDQQDGRISLELTYNFYSGGRIQSETRRAHSDINVAKQLHYKTCIDMRQNLQIAYNDTQKIAERTPNLEKHALATNNVRAAYLAQFEIGQRTLLDLLDAENEHFTASQAFTNAMYDLEISHARTLAGMGQLLSTLDVIRDGIPNLQDLGAQPYNIQAQHTCALPMSQRQPIQLITKELETHHKVMVNFDINSSIIKEEYVPEIEKIATIMIEHPQATLTLKGHSSLVGSEEYNMWLSLRRANAVSKVLSDRFGIDPDRVSAVGFGFSRPIINSQTPQAHKINQRIEAIIEHSTPQSNSW